jgi:hypothetical protein
MLLFYNSTKRTDIYAKLGRQHRFVTFQTQIAHCRKDGGPISCIRGIISRSYPVIYFDKQLGARRNERAHILHLEQEQKRIQQDFDYKISLQHKLMLNKDNLSSESINHFSAREDSESMISQTLKYLHMKLSEVPPMNKILSDCNSSRTQQVTSDMGSVSSTTYPAPLGQEILFTLWRCSERDEKSLAEGKLVTVYAVTLTSSTKSANNKMTSLFHVSSNKLSFLKIIGDLSLQIPQVKMHLQQGTGRWSEHLTELALLLQQRYHNIARRSICASAMHGKSCPQNNHSSTKLYSRDEAIDLVGTLIAVYNDQLTNSTIGNNLLLSSRSIIFIMDQHGDLIMVEVLQNDEQRHSLSAIYQTKWVSANTRDSTDVSKSFPKLIAHSGQNAAVNSKIIGGPCFNSNGSSCGPIFFFPELCPVVMMYDVSYQIFDSAHNIHVAQTSNLSLLFVPAKNALENISNKRLNLQYENLGSKISSASKNSFNSAIASSSSLGGIPLSFCVHMLQSCMQQYDFVDSPLGAECIATQITKSYKIIQELQQKHSMRSTPINQIPLLPSASLSNNNIDSMLDIDDSLLMTQESDLMVMNSQDLLHFDNMLRNSTSIVDRT